MRGEELRAPAVVRQGRERAQDRGYAARIGTVVGLQSPDRDQNLRRDAEALLDARQGGVVRAHQALPAPHQPGADAPRIKLLKRQLEGPLRAVEPDHGWIVADA